MGVPRVPRPKSHGTPNEISAQPDQIENRRFALARPGHSAFSVASKGGWGFRTLRGFETMGELACFGASVSNR
jgi:hypothetical protein